jgi:hypothetical protein
VVEPGGLSLNLEVVADKYLSAFKEKVQQRLQHDLSPEQFEEFAGKLLTAYGSIRRYQSNRAMAV